jgi:DNA-binding CsgD family transcriptional regulator
MESAAKKGASMEHLKIAHYLLVLLVGVAALAYVVLMARVHRLPFLKPFAFFLGFSNLTALANLTSAYAYANLFGFSSRYESTVYPMVLGSVSRLSQVGIVYALFAIAYGFRGHHLSRAFKVISSLIGGILLISYVVRGVLPEEGAVPLWIARGQLAIFHLSALAIIGSLLAILISSRNIQSVAERKAVRVFAISYLSLYAVFVITYPLPLEMRFPPTALALLGINVVPFIWFGKLFAQAYLAAPPSTEDREAFHRFCRDHGLTSREADVLKLILRGRSNADIGKELFISIHTVKNHITNVHAKLGVRSRWQLISLFHSDQQERLSTEPLSS